MYLCPGGGGVATLQVGTSKSKFNAQFNNVTTAQQLSDLINKDLRRGKNAITFSPSFSLEDAEADEGSVVANVHHEFMSSANADYGGGQIKITSMRRGDAGETATIAVTNEDGISITGANSLEGKVVSSTASTITVVDGNPLADYGIIKIGATVGYYTSKTGNVLNGVVDLTGDISAAAVLNAVVHQTRLTIDYVGGTTGDEGRLRDWWADYDLGIIYFNNTYPYFSWNAVKVSYVYGERYVEKAIEDICTKLVAMDLILSDDRSVLLPEGTQNVDLGSKYQLLKAQVAETLPRYVEVMTLE